MDLTYYLFFPIYLAFISLIIASLWHFNETKSLENKTFVEKFLRCFFIVCSIMIIGSIMEQCGCSNPDEYNYPIK